MKEVKIALIARMDNSGLGTLSWEFARNLKPHKVLLVDNDANQSFPERYSDFDNRIAKTSIQGQLRDWLLDDVDVLLSIETFYDWSLIKDCRRKNIKTALYTMIEMSPDPLPLVPDLCICPSKIDVDRFADYRHVLIPPPVALDRIHWKKRTKATTFIHTASHGGVRGRKGTGVFLDAIKQVKADVKFIIYTWKGGIDFYDKRTEIKTVNFKNYWQLWREGDVLVYPQGANGICLPIIEAMTAGMGVITTDFYPFNEYMPKDLLFPIKGFKKIKFGGNLTEVDDPIFDAESIANKIDEYANKSIEKYSLYGLQWGKENSWEKLYGKFREALMQVMQL